MRWSNHVTKMKLKISAAITYVCDQNEPFEFQLPTTLLRKEHYWGTILGTYIFTAVGLYIAAVTVKWNGYVLFLVQYAKVPPLTFLFPFW